MAAKIEVAMKKSEAMLWARLDLPPVTPPKENEKKEETDSEDEDEWGQFIIYLFKELPLLLSWNFGLYSVFAVTSKNA